MESRRKCYICTNKDTFAVKRLFLAIILVSCALALLAACVKTTYLPDPEDAPSGAPLVTVLYDPGALGDLAFNDLVYKGVEDAAVEYGVRTRQLSPSSREEGLELLSATLEGMSSSTDTVRRLLIVAGPGYDEFLRANNHRLEANPRADLLYFETTEPLEGKGSSLHISFYGAMYEAGAVTPLYSEDVLVVAANPVNSGVVDAVAGFQAGFATDYLFPENNRTLSLEYLSDDPAGGFTIDDATAMELVYQKHPLPKGTVVPICGGAASVFRRQAEYTGFHYVMGVDRVIPSTATCFAAVKHSDAAVKRCIGQWLSPEGMPKHQSLGLADGFTEMVFCPAEPTDMEIVENNISPEMREAIHLEALEKEAEYEQ